MTGGGYDRFLTTTRILNLSAVEEFQRIGIKTGISIQHRKATSKDEAEQRQKSTCFQGMEHGNGSSYSPSTGKGLTGCSFGKKIESRGKHERPDMGGVRSAANTLLQLV
jgi:hypothetical protein